MASATTRQPATESAGTALVAALTLSLAMCGPAAAGWSYTDWEMTLDDLLAASDAAVTPLEEPIELESGDVVLAAGQLTVEPHAYEVHFVFTATDGVLDWVRLRLLRGPQSDLYQILVNRYGEPYESDSERTESGHWFVARFLDAEENNRIIYYADDEICTVRYEPIARGAPPGG